MDLYVGGKAVKVGAVLKDFRGEEWTFLGVTRAARGSSSGRVYMARREWKQEFFPSAFGGEIRDASGRAAAERITVKVECSMPQVDKRYVDSEGHADWILYLRCGEASAAVTIFCGQASGAARALSTWTWNDFDPEQWTNDAGEMVEVDRTLPVRVTGIEQERYINGEEA